MRSVGMDDSTSILETATGALHDAFVSCVWSQWMLLGGTADAARPGGAVPPIDPEALLLASLVLLEAEPRLADVLHGWLRANSALVSVQRFRNLAPHYAGLAAPEGAARLAWLAQVARVDAKDARWRGFPMPAAASILRAPSARAREKAPPPVLRPSAPHQLLLRVRLGFGVSIKADVITYLLEQGADWRTIREIAAALTYTVAPVRRALEDLANAAFLERRTGHPVHYRADAARWRSFLGTSGDVPRWGEWDARFRFAAEWLTWARAPRRTPFTSYVLSVEARERFARFPEVFEASAALVDGGDPMRTLAEMERQLERFTGALRSIGGGA